MPYLVKLKQLIAAFALTAIASTAFGQSAQTEVEITQEVFGLEKKLVISKFMGLGDDDKAFWDVYNAYEVERKAIGKERIDVIVEYGKSYPDLSEERIMALYKRVEGVRKATSKLQKKYFKQMRKAVGTSKAAQFWQIENYYATMIQAEIYTRLPFIGENLDGK